MRERVRNGLKEGGGCACAAGQRRPSGGKQQPAVHMHNEREGWRRSKTKTAILVTTTKARLVTVRAGGMMGG